MKAIVFGATGMVGQGVLRECLLDPEIERVLTVGRAATGQKHEKLHELVVPDPSNLLSASGVGGAGVAAGIENELSGYDACFFCLGVSSAGMKEADYRRVTYDLTLSVASVLSKLNPAMTFIYVSGAGTDSSARGRSMWARVKGETENALLKLPFKAAYMFRPGFIQPLHGIVSRTRIYRWIYAVLGPIYPLLNALAPKYITTTERVGRAMLVVAKRGGPTAVLENRDINALA